MPSDFLERTLEDIVFDNRDKIHMKGLKRLKSKSFRQVILPSGKKLDILSYDISNSGHLSFDIYELKRDYINIEAVCQAYNYYNEIGQLIDGHFKSWDASIVMVGKRYDNISILAGMKIPISVYTYEYGYDGITFKDADVQSSPYHSDNERFSLGVLAIGIDKVVFRDRYYPSTMSFHSVLHNQDDDFLKSLKSHKEGLLKPPPKKEIQIELKKEPPVIQYIKTEIFPEQPAWTSDFICNSIHPTTIFDDLEEDLSDFEPEEVELDMSDYEPDHEEREDGECSDIYEPINLSEWLNGIRIELPIIDNRVGKYVFKK